MSYHTPPEFSHYLPHSCLSYHVFISMACPHLCLISSPQLNRLPHHLPCIPSLIFLFISFLSAHSPLFSIHLILFAHSFCSTALPHLIHASASFYRIFPSSRLYVCLHFFFNLSISFSSFCFAFFPSRYLLSFLCCSYLSSRSQLHQHSFFFT